MIRITTTHRPKKEIEVEASEFRDLDAQGLIHSVLGGDLASVGKSKKDKKDKAPKAPQTSKAPVVEVAKAPADAATTEAGLQPAKLDPEGGE